MKSNRVLSIICVIAGFMLLFSPSGFAGPPMEMKRTIRQPAAQTPVIQEKKVKQPVEKIYSISIDDISLTSQCQLKFILKNTGTDLTNDQHKNCSVKVGQNSPIPFTSLDPGGRLKTKGQTITYLENDPLTKDTNIAIEVTLFNGAKKTKQKSLHPTCPNPMKELTQITESQSVQKKVIPAPMTVKSGGSPAGKKLLAATAQPSTMPETILQVKRLGGDLETWSTSGSMDTSLQRMDFRWKTREEALNIARWEAALSPDFPHAIAQGQITPMPPKDTYGYFSIDFNSFSGAYAKPITFYIHVKPVKQSTSSMSAFGRESTPSIEITEYEPSPAVKITLTEAGSTPQTEINLPKTHLKVVFEKILLVNDSDDMSGGDLGFKFVVHGMGKETAYSADKWDSGETIPLNDMVFIITDPPDFARISVFGCDNDEAEALPGSPFCSSCAYRELCGDDPDTASVEQDISTGISLGRTKIPPVRLDLSAQGPKLKFQVYGFWELYCDPCP